MLGYSRVLMEVPLAQLDLTLWTEEQVIEVCREAFTGDAKSGHVFQVWLDNAIAGPLSKIQAFIGDTETLDGGTQGELIIQPDYVHTLYELLIDALASIAHCAVPEYLVLNNNDIGALTMANYVWHVCIK